jgi:chromate transporter
MKEQYQIMCVEKKQDTKSSLEQKQDLSKLSRSKILRKIFFQTLYLSTFTFGGGYVIVSLLKKKFVDDLHWIDDDEMLDLVAIAQSSPGAIAVNGAIVLGEDLAGFPGVLCAVSGAILPPFVIIGLISSFYNLFKGNFVVQALLSGMGAGVAAVVISVALDMGSDIVKSKDSINLMIMILAFIANYFFNVNVIWIILAAALIGVIRAFAGRRGEKQ